MENKKYDLINETDPDRIEKKSFEIIDAHVNISAYPPICRPVVRRLVHTTGDFQFAETVDINEEAVRAGMRAIRSGAKIICDVNMVETGINKNRLAPFKSSIITAISHPAVARLSEKEGVTRAIKAAEFLKDEMDGAVILCGNAPTFLFRVVDFIDKNEIKPALVVGMPVGFVGAAESKEALCGLSSRVSLIANRGNKGGAALCAAVINALVKNILAEDKGIEIS